MRKIICDECKKEIKENEEYVTVVSTLEEMNESRRIKELGEKELKTFHKKCAKEEIIPKNKFD